MTLADELQRLADEAARSRQRIDELARACAELRRLLAALAPPSTAPEAAHPTMEAP